MSTSTEDNSAKQPDEGGGFVKRAINLAGSVLSNVMIKKRKSPMRYGPSRRPVRNKGDKPHMRIDNPVLWEGDEYDNDEPMTEFVQAQGGDDA